MFGDMTAAIYATQLAKAHAEAVVINAKFDLVHARFVVLTDDLDPLADADVIADLESRLDAYIARLFGEDDCTPYMQTTKDFVAEERLLDERAAWEFHETQLYLHW